MHIPADQVRPGQRIDGTTVTSVQTLPDDDQVCIGVATGAQHPCTLYRWYPRHALVRVDDDGPPAP